MIVNMHQNRSELEGRYPELDKRMWRYATEGVKNYGSHPGRTSPVMVEFRKMIYPLPLLFLSGVFTGVGIMLALN